MENNTLPRIVSFFLTMAFGFLQVLLQSDDLNDKQSVKGQFRHRRSVFLTDTNIVSRIQAGTSAARIALANSIFGRLWPGKRSERNIPNELYEIFNKQEHEQERNLGSLFQVRLT